MTEKDFILLHRNDDIRTLALNAPRDAGFDIGHALEQIAGWQKARTKLPMWAANDDIIYPPHISMEQCSSERTAGYKAGLCERLMKETEAEGETVLTDITGGFGVDFSYMAAAFGKAVYVERQSLLCDISRHNLKALGISGTEVINADSEDYLKEMEPSTVIFADPARRDSNGARTFAMSDCTPDVLGMKGLLLDKSAFTVLKLSPMLDWRKAVSDFGSCAGEVHIVSSGNECKELLLVISNRYNGLRRIFCVNDDSVMDYTPAEAEAAETSSSRFADSGLLSRFSSASHKPQQSDNLSPAPLYLYEPNPSVMKADCHALAGLRYGARELSRDSHLLISETSAHGFPGRKFIVSNITTMNRRELKAALGGLKKANITVRNFPLKVAELRKRLKIAEGGDTYIFATTTRDGEHKLFICRKEERETWLN